MRLKYQSSHPHEFWMPQKWYSDETFESEYDKTRLDNQFGICIRAACYYHVLLLPAGGLRCRRCFERLFEIGDDIVNVFCADGDTDEILKTLVSFPKSLREKSGMLTSVTPEAILSSSVSCSWVVDHG